MKKTWCSWIFCKKIHFSLYPSIKVTKKKSLHASWWNLLWDYILHQIFLHFFICFFIIPFFYYTLLGISQPLKSFSESKKKKREEKNGRELQAIKSFSTLRRLKRKNANEEKKNYERREINKRRSGRETGAARARKKIK